MRKIILIFITLLLLSGCEKETDLSDIPTMPPAQEVVEITTAVETDVPGYDEENAWLFEINENASNIDNSINLKNFLSPGRVCYIAETDTLFWSDNTGFYMSSGDTTVRLTEMSAMCINVLCGRVYFINDNIKPDLITNNGGKAYFIDLKTGECKLFIDETISKLSVSGGDLIYVKQEKVMYEGRELTANYTFRCDADGRNHQKALYKYLVSDGENCAGANTGKGVHVYSLENDEEIYFAEDNRVSSGVVSLFNGELQFFCGGGKEFGVVRRINLSDNSVQDYYFPKNYIEDYAFANDKFCYTDRSFFVIADENGSTSYYRPYSDGLSIKAIYSGGEHIYASRTDGKIVRLGFEENILQNKVTEEILSYEEN